MIAVTQDVQIIKESVVKQNTQAPGPGPRVHVEGDNVKVTNCGQVKEFTCNGLGSSPVTSPNSHIVSPQGVTVTGKGAIVDNCANEERAVYNGVTYEGPVNLQLPIGILLSDMVKGGQAVKGFWDSKLPAQSKLHLEDNLLRKLDAYCTFQTLFLALQRPT